MAYTKTVGTKHGKVDFSIEVESERGGPPNFSLSIDAVATLPSGERKEVATSSNMGFRYQREPSDANVLEEMENAVRGICMEFEREQEKATTPSAFQLAGWSQTH